MKQRNRGKRFGPAVVAVDRDENGEARGSSITFDGRVWRIPAWPARLADVRPTGDGGIVITLEGGSQRLLELSDAA